MKFNSVYLKKEGKEYKKRMIQYIIEEVKEQQWNKIENEFLYLDEIVYMNKKGRDADNLKKLTQDVISESLVVWTDDTYCLPRTQRVYIDSQNPRIDLTITKTGFVGIFDDRKDYDNFVNTYCHKCKKGNKIGQKGGCKIYKTALEGRIQDDLHIDFTTGEKKCLKFKDK